MRNFVTAIFLLLGLPVVFPAQAGERSSRNLIVIPKWSRFEVSFKSATAYAHPVQDATIKVVFSSPQRESFEVQAFWDGGRTWRARFAPNLAGHWSFVTKCSDASNRGLHHQSGEFLCTAPKISDRFHEHGPVRIARDHRHFEHEDGAPFFWLADTAWTAAQRSTQGDWELYARARAEQHFNVVQLRIGAPGQNTKGPFPEGERINPEFFQMLDKRIGALNRAGILAAISVSPGVDQPGGSGSSFLRYLLARHAADQVAWLVEPRSGESSISKWKTLGNTELDQPRRALVIILAGRDQTLLKEFAHEQWVDALACQFFPDLSEEVLKSSFDALPPSGTRAGAMKPIISMLPPENEPSPVSSRRGTADDLRPAAYWTLLMTGAAGFIYSARAVADWDESKDHSEKLPLPLWQRSLFLPGAKQLAIAAKFAESNSVWNLLPQSDFVAVQPGAHVPHRFIAAAASEERNLSAVYVPEDRTLEILLEALPPSPLVSWLNPRTGENTPAVAVVGNRSCQFPTPGTGDWLLVMRAGPGALKSQGR